MFRRTSDHVRVLTVAGDGGNVETIRTTDEHPFWVEGRGWTDAGDLGAGDQVQESDGTWQTVQRSDREVHADGLTVYNVEVEGDHTYFVEDGAGAADAVWVHNRCVGRKFMASYDGKPVEFDGAFEVRFFRRDDLSISRIENEFPAKRKRWLMRMAQEEASIQQLRAAGLSEDQIRDIANTGVLPDPKWQVHHKHGIALGGDNTDDNFMIFRDTDSMYHSALTNAHRDILAELPAPGDAADRMFPMFDGVVIFTR